MAFVAVDKDGTEYVLETTPIRRGDYWRLSKGWRYCELPHGSIEKLIGRPLTWSDEPVELKNELI